MSWKPKLSPKKDWNPFAQLDRDVLKPQRDNLRIPGKTPEELALIASQTRELDRQGSAINEKKRRTLRSQLGTNSLYSGGERGVRRGETRSSRPPLGSVNG